MNLSIQISPHVLTDFMAADLNRQRKIVLAAKYPRDGDAFALIYYAEARLAIQRYFDNRRDSAPVLETIAKMREEAALTSKELTRVRLRHNARALEKFLSSELAAQPFKSGEKVEAMLPYGPVSVAVKPMVCLKDARGATEWLQLDLSQTDYDANKAATIVQLFLRASDAAGAILKPGHAQYHHLASGASEKGLRPKVRLENQISAACETFANIWSAI